LVFEIGKMKKTFLTFEVKKEKKNKEGGRRKIIRK